MNVGDKVRVKPSEAHYHSNGIGTVVAVHGTSAFNALVELVSPTRRPSLISHTTYRRATALVNFYFGELEVVV